MKYYIATLVILAAFFGCSSNNGSEPQNTCVPSCGQDLDKIVQPQTAPLDLVNFLTNRIVNPDLTKMGRSISEMNRQVTNACLLSEPVEVAEVAKNWESAMRAFHQVEVFVFGPLITDDIKKIGDNNPLKHFLYSQVKPQSQASKIDKEIGRASKKAAKYDLKSRKATIGLDAAEYVLFERLKEEEELNENLEECWYFYHLTNDLAERSAKLLRLWKGRVIDPLKTANGRTKANVYIDQYASGLIDFVDKTLKDRNLAVPLGLPTGNSKSFPCVAGQDCHLLYLSHPFEPSAFHRMATGIALETIEKSFGDPDSVLKENFGFGSYIRFTSELESLEYQSKMLKSFSEDLYSKTWIKLPSDEEYIDLFASFNPGQPDGNKIYQGFVKIKSMSDYLKKEFVSELTVNLPGSVQGDPD